MPNLKRAGEVIAPKVEGEKAGNSNGNQDVDDGDVDGMTSGNTVDSTQVKGTQLAEKSQHMRQSRRTQNGHLPVSPGSPIQLGECPYGHVRHWR